MRLNPKELLSRLQASYWFVPLLVALGGTGAAVLLLALDSRVDQSSLGTIGRYLPSTPAGAQSLLSAIISSMITAISVTFSVTIVALTVAAQHFGPRVLNNFVRHTASQIVLGTFIATFIYAVLVLGAVGSDPSIPRLSVAGAVVLVLLSVGALIYYVHHVSTALQVGELTAEIAEDFRTALQRDRAADGPEDEQIPNPPREIATIPMLESGYVQRVDYDSIASHASERNASVWVRREPGAFIVAGAAFVLVTPPSACDDALTAAVRRACVLGRDRTLWHDPEFAVKQLVEIALRALSPGVNEPFTAITCIDRLTEGLARALTAPKPRGAWRDTQGVARVFAEPQGFANLLRAAFDPIRISAGGNPGIYARLGESLGELGLVCIRREDTHALLEQLQLLRRTAADAIKEEYDRGFAERRIAHAYMQFEAGPSGTRK